MLTKAHPLRGYLSIAGATFLWGISACLGRAMFTGHAMPGGAMLAPLDPLILAQARTTISLLVLFPVLCLTRGRSLALPKKDLCHVMVLGILGVAASNYLYYLAIQKTNVAIAITIQYTAPAWVLLYLALRGRQRATLPRVAAVVLASLGCTLVIGLIGGGQLQVNAAGLIAAVLASFSFAFYNVGGHDILARYDRWKVLLYTLASAAGFWIVVNPPWKIAAARYSYGQWLFLWVFAMTSALLPFSLYFRGLQHLPPTSAVVTSCLEPVFSIVLAALLLRELVRPLQLIGILLVLAATVLVQRPERDPRDEVAAVEPIE
ncbi:MAG: EamA family transporter [Acidobacteria bacterium]|nr:EamA family transporter [Acidobacteriota bacterium]